MKIKRQVVPKSTAEKGKTEGVVQKKPDGSWGIISYKTNPPTFWNADYDTKEDAENALKAYHANRR